ncbi:MAG TPA: hypothetical protein VMX13_07435 [Sedimentisphaerales bacterium]|nr:hypothetical protein [Sedimentisphaerales bacterium]
MKMQKWKLICCGLLVMAMAVGFTAVSAARGQIRLLSDGELASLTGGVTWCNCGAIGSKCKCQTKDCSDIECSQCSSERAPGGTAYYCKGNDGDDDDVTACYKTSNSSDSCTEGTPAATNCQGDVWTSSGCTPVASPDYATDVWFKNDGCSL